MVDYLLGDLDRDGYIEKAQGAVLDYDGDGNPPYEEMTETFDEDDWGEWDYYEDNLEGHTFGNPGYTYSTIWFDHNLDNHLDIDWNYDPDHLQVDGTDLDNQGLFDGIDMNDDGDMDDWVSIDEKIAFCTAGRDMFDDDLAIFLDWLAARVVSVVMLPCFSGGFIDDLSAPNRVIATATEEETASYGNLFMELFTSAFHRATRSGSPVDADADGNGHISMREAFNYAAENDCYDEIPQYDDNGDGIGHPYPIPQGGEGDLGGMTYLESFYGLALAPLTATQPGEPGRVVTYTLQVTHTGGATDSFDVLTSDHTWLVAAPTAVGPVYPGASASIDVAVTIPIDAADGATETVTVVVRSLHDDTQWVSVTLTTVAVREHLSDSWFLPLVFN